MAKPFGTEMSQQIGNVGWVASVWFYRGHPYRDMGPEGQGIGETSATALRAARTDALNRYRVFATN
jgi:hypothetical protein